MREQRREGFFVPLPMLRGLLLACGLLAASLLLAAACGPSNDQDADRDESSITDGASPADASPGEQPADPATEAGATTDTDISGDEAAQDRKADDKLAGAVRSAVEHNCSEASLRAVERLNPSYANLRRAIMALSASKKLRNPQQGISHGRRIRFEHRCKELDGLSFDFSIYVPQRYKAAPDKPFALWVNPAHPTDRLRNDTWLKHLSNLAGGRFLLVTVNFVNRVALELNEEQQKAFWGRGSAAYHDYFAALDAVIAQMKESFHIDPRRVYVGGISAVGASAWFHGIFSSHNYAAICPISIIPAPFDPELYRNLSNLGILVVHGTADKITPVGKVRPMLKKMREWGLSPEYWELEGEGHGTMFNRKFGDMVEWLLKRRRSLTPSRVHKAIKSPRQARAYWLAATGFSASLPAEARLYPTAAPAVVDATWKEGEVKIKAKGVDRLELYWLDGASGEAGRGKTGDRLKVTVEGRTPREFELREDPTVALEEYCRYRDTSRL